MRGLLEVIRVQRHDFMNHLQVISGLLQLGHYDRAKEYIRQAADEIQQKSALTRLGSPEVAAAILRAELAAAKNNIQINTLIDIDGDEIITLPCDMLEVLELLLDAPTMLVEGGQCARAAVTLNIGAENRYYLFRVSFKCCKGSDELLAEKTTLLDRAAGSVNGEFRVVHGEAGCVVFTLAVPTVELMCI